MDLYKRLRVLKRGSLVLQEVPGNLHDQWITLNLLIDPKCL